MKAIILIRVCDILALHQASGAEEVFAVTDLVDGKGRAQYFYSALGDAENHEMPQWAQFGILASESVPGTAIPLLAPADVPETLLIPAETRRLSDKLSAPIPKLASAPKKGKR